MARIKSTCTSLLFAFAILSSASATPTSHPTSSIKCPITIDGRVPVDTLLKTLDTNASPFNPNYTKGQNLSWSQIIKFPSIEPSKFDFSSSSTPNMQSNSKSSAEFKPLEVTINDSSLFIPGGSSVQVGFRRAGLLLGNGTDASVVGAKTFHWSVRQDPRLSMNLTHEYMNVWHELNDYSANQFSVNAGVMLSQDWPVGGNVSTSGLGKRKWKVLDRKNDVIWMQEIKEGVWQNFGVVVDYVGDTLQIFYSEDYDPLEAVTKPLPNDNSGGGQFQVGILKKPTETKSVVFDGYQESGIYEGQIYGGIFIEDSEGGCISR